MYHSAIPGAEHKIECHRKGRESKRISTDAVSVTAGEGRYKGKKEGGGRMQKEIREQESTGGSKGEK